MGFSSNKDIHSILLDIGMNFHQICVKHCIPYYMLGGTMLGAIRHKGFIPWDDDMDFGVPREYFDDCVDYLKKELPNSYSVLDVKNSDSIINGCVKISNNRTLIEELYRSDKDESLGVNIDVFPLDEVRGDGNLESKVKFLMLLQNYRFLSAKDRPFFKRILSCFVKVLFFFLKKHTVVDLVNSLIQKECGNFIANVYGSWCEKETIDKNIMGSPVLYKFETTQFFGVDDYDSYLKKLYGDYMKIPKISERHFHVLNFRWK